MKTKLILFSLLCAASVGAASFLDTSFNPGTGANGLVESALVLSTGKILICGNFTTYNNTNASYMARLNSDGSLDYSFKASPSYWVRTMALQSDGKIVIGGFFTSVSGQSRNLVARLNSDGSLDTNFDVGTGATGVLGGAIDGDPDPFVFATAIQSDGKILITGNFTNYDGATRWGIARLNTDGSLDTLFDVGAGFNTNSWGRSLLVQKNGQIMVTGWFTSYDNHAYNRMVRLNPNGSADTTFNPFFGDLTAIYSVQQLANGEYLVSGDSQNTNLFRQDMARLESNGAFDTNFVGASNDKTESVRVDSSGRVLIGGYFSTVDKFRQLNLARLNANGVVDTNFTPSIDNFVWSIALQSDNKILIVGGFQNVEGASRSGIARLLPNATTASGPSTVSAAAGSYAGLFYNPDAFTNDDAGYITVTVGARSNYTARLILKTAAYAWAGKFDSNSMAQKTIMRRNQDEIDVTLELVGDNAVQGRVNIGDFRSSINAYRNTFNRLNPASAYAGRYTALLQGGSPGAPAGDGYIAANVNNAGGFAMAGALADGTPYSRGGWISDTGLAPFYICYRGGTDVALGWIDFGTNVGGSVYWSKDFSALLPVTGEPYVIPARGNAPLDLTNGAVTVSGADLTNSTSQSFTFEPVARFIFPPVSTNVDRFSLSLTLANGVFTGRFLDPVSRRYDIFHGVILQNENAGAGYFGTQGGLVTFGSP